MKKFELREAITRSVDGIECKPYLRMILEVSEIFRKGICEEFTELTDLQYGQRKAIRNILNMNSVKDIESINAVIDAMREYDERRGTDR